MELFRMLWNIFRSRHSYPCWLSTSEPVLLESFWSDTGLSLNMKVGGELWEVGGEHWMRLRIHLRAPKARSLKGGLCDLPQENFEKWSVIWCYLVHSEVIFRLLLRFRFHDEILSVESEWTLEVHKNSTQNILEEVYIIQGKMLTDFNEYL